MENVFHSHDWIIIFLRLVITIFFASTILSPFLLVLRRMMKEKRFLVELNGMESIFPLFYLAGVVVVYSLLFAYENPNYVGVAVLQGFCSILCLVGILGMNVMQLRMTRGQWLVDEILRNLKLKK